MDPDARAPRDRVGGRLPDVLRGIRSCSREAPAEIPYPIPRVDGDRSLDLRHPGLLATVAGLGRAGLCRPRVGEPAVRASQ